MAKKPKKLKEIPFDIITYLYGEIKDIKTERDRELILGYAKDKFKLANWYIDLLECNSQNYIVPQSYEDLASMTRQLHTVIEKIKCTPLPNSKGTIDYPEGYEG